MQLILSKTTDADNVINKTLTDSQNIVINLKRDTDIINPVLILLRVPGVDFHDYNYCQIVELQRYYFIRNVNILNDRMFSLNCECDYLETFKADILASDAQYKTRIASGLYGSFQPETTGVTVESIHESNVELVPSDSAIFSVMRWQ